MAALLYRRLFSRIDSHYQADTQFAPFRNCITAIDQDNFLNIGNTLVLNWAIKELRKDRVLTATVSIYREQVRPPLLFSSHSLIAMSIAIAIQLRNPSHPL